MASVNLLGQRRQTLVFSIAFVTMCLAQGTIGAGGDQPLEDDRDGEKDLDLAIQEVILRQHLHTLWKREVTLKDLSLNNITEELTMITPLEDDDEKEEEDEVYYYDEEEKDDEEGDGEKDDEEVKKGTNSTDPTAPAAAPTTTKAKARKIWDNGRMSLATMKSILGIARIFSLTFSVLSVAAVAFAVFVFSNKRMKNRVTLLFIAFNLSEGFKVVVFAFNRVWKLALGSTPITWHSPYTVYFTHFVTWAPDATGRISLLLNLIITVDRFIVLAFPLKSLNRKVVVYPKLTIALVVVLVLCLQCSTLVVVITLVADNFNRTRQFRVPEIVAELGMASPQAMNIYRIVHVVASVCFRYVPLIVTIVLNITTIVSLVYHSRDRRLAGAVTRTGNGTGNGNVNVKRQPSSSSSSAAASTAAAETASGASSSSRAAATVTTSGGKKTEPEAAAPAAMSTAQVRKRQNNLMIVGSTLIYSFLVSVKPAARVVSMLHPTFGEAKVDLYLYNVVNELVLILDIASPLVTFISYLKLSSAFRQVFLRLFFKASIPRSDSLRKPSKKIPAGN